MNHLFRFSISPVQSFIEQTRKAQDLYAGSRILSELALTAAREAENQGIELVFPIQSESSKSFPNRLTGILKSNFTQEELQIKGQAIEDKVRAVFKGIAEKALEKAEHKDNPPKDFWNQIESHLDINWLFYPFENDYSEAFHASDQLMAALKNTRFISNPSPEKGRKCNLDGERNALFRGQGTTNSILLNQAVEINGLKTGVWLAPNEGLSAVSLMKRAYDDAQGFPSTAAVALDCQKSILSEENQKLLKCYEQLFSSGYLQACTELLKSGELKELHLQQSESKIWHTRFDEQLLYEENLTDKNIPNSTQLDVARKVQRKLSQYLTHKYYALICFDVDKMGELLTGSNAETQKKISEKLMAFGGSISENPDLKNLHVVYAGGDDFLGFVNLKNLFEVVRTLRTTFDEQVSKALGEAITFSMGIAIAHYKTPLHIVLQTARAMQKTAKAEDKGNRDAVAIKVLKHSGEGHETYFKWENGIKWDALQQLTERLLEDCSDTFIRVLEREFSALQDNDGNLTDKEDHRREVEEVLGILVEVHKKVRMLPAELLRLAHRSLKEGKKDKAVDLRDTILRLFEEAYDMRYRTIPIQNALEALKIAIFIHRKTKAKTK